MNIQDAIRNHNQQAIGQWWLLKFFGGLVLGIFFGLAALGALVQHSVLETMIFALFSAVGWVLCARAHRRARRLVGGGPRDERHERGTFLHDARAVTPLLNRAPGDLAIGGVPLPRSVEQQHILMVGAPGSGKSVALKALMKTIRERHSDGAVIHDPTGEFVSLFYDPARDLIINPLDSRHAPWSLWTDLMLGEEASLAKAIIPSAEGDNKYFSDAAQATLEVLFQQTDTIDDLVMAGLSETNDRLIERLTQAGLGGLVGSSKTFASVRGNMAPYLRALALLPDTARGDGLTLKEFCTYPAGRFIFLLTSGRTRETLRPIHQLFLNQIVSVATSLRPDPTRRIWLTLDEAPVLLPSPAIALALAEGRKYGLSVILAAQALGQVKHRIGEHEAAAVLSMPKTRLILRVGDGETAEAMSREIGERQLTRQQVSVSKTAGDVATANNSTSTTWQTVTERTVLASEIMSLPDLQGFLRIEDTTMRVALTYESYPPVGPDYDPVPPRGLPVAQGPGPVEASA